MPMWTSVDCCVCRVPMGMAQLAQLSPGFRPYFLDSRGCQCVCVLSYTRNLLYSEHTLKSISGYTSSLCQTAFIGGGTIFLEQVEYSKKRLLFSALVLLCCQNQLGIDYVDFVFLDAEVGWPHVPFTFP